MDYILNNTSATPMGRKVYAHLWRVFNFKSGVRKTEIVEDKIDFIEKVSVDDQVFEEVEIAM